MPAKQCHTIRKGSSLISSSSPIESAAQTAAPEIFIGPVSVAEGTLRVTNEELAQRFNTSPEVILRKIGIESRPRATPETTPKELAFAAAAPLYDHPAFDPAALAMVIVSSSSISQACPPVACEILGQIQTSHPVTPHAMAFDIMATCTGWLYSLSLACDHLHQPNNRRKSALIITTEIFSQGIAEDDFGSQASFGDVATATLVFGPDAPAARQPGNLAMQRPHCLAWGDTDGILWGAPLNMDAKLVMNGHAMRQTSMPAMVKGMRIALEAAGLGPSDLHLVVAHQSNQRILNDVATELGIAPDKLASNLRHRGSTSSSSLPLLLHDLRSDPETSPPTGATLGFTAFGGGFTYGGAIARVL